MSYDASFLLAQLQLSPPWAGEALEAEPVTGLNLQSFFQTVPRHYAGIGVATLVLITIGSKLIWRQPSPNSIGSIKGDLKQMQAALATTVASQKELERQHSQVQHKVAEWAQRADQATRSGDQHLLEHALSEKRILDLQAAELSRSLQEVNTQASALRDTIGHLEGRLKAAQHRAGIVA